MKRLAFASALFGLLGAATISGTAAADDRPSILLIVIDTLRADAVSSYGEIAHTTPELDALASGGLRYERAYSSAPWTLPSHATILTGLDVEQHRVGMGSRGSLPDEIVTLAERLQAAGYDTAAVSENAIVSDVFGLAQGFEHYRSTRLGESDGAPMPINGETTVKMWLSRRESKRPFFLFVNLADPHHPYEIRNQNRFVAPGTPRESIRARPDRPNRLICGGVPDAKMLAVLRGLYLGDVHAADAKVGEITRAVRGATNGSGPIVVVASDHGEYFGEDRLMGHEFGLHEVVLRVPLIVNGLKGVSPSVIPDTVGLLDLAPTILGWAGVEIPKDMPGKPLPRQSSGGPGDRAMYAYYSDAAHWMPDSWRQHGLNPYDPKDTRQFCSERDPVWGGIAAIIRYPYKFVWYERSKPELFDLSWDPGQKSDQAAHQSKSAKDFSQSIAPRIDAAGLRGSGSEAPELSKEALDALRALGYAE